MNDFIGYKKKRWSETEMIRRSEEFYMEMDRRRSVREFSDEPIPAEVIDNAIKTASTAPSGAHKQPWTFCVVTDPAVKKKIRVAAEKEEMESYNGRMSEEWLSALAPLGTTWEKPFLEIAPVLIVVFRKSYDLVDGARVNNYYVTESVGLACGLLLAALEHAGLASLTHTPSPMNFLARLLERPENEKPFLLIPVGYPSETCKVPDLKRKPLESIVKYYK